MCLVLGSCGCVSLASTRSTCLATSSAAAAGVRVRVHRSFMVMRTRNPRAAAVIHATAIRDGGTNRNSVSVNNNNTFRSLNFQRQETYTNYYFCNKHVTFVYDQ